MSFKGTIFWVSGRAVSGPRTIGPVPHRGPKRPPVAPIPPPLAIAACYGAVGIARFRFGAPRFGASFWRAPESQESFWRAADADGDDEDRDDDQGTKKKKKIKRKNK